MLIRQILLAVGVALAVVGWAIVRTELRKQLLPAEDTVAEAVGGGALLIGVGVALIYGGLR